MMTTVACAAAVVLVGGLWLDFAMAMLLRPKR